MSPLNFGKYDEPDNRIKKYRFGDKINDINKYFSDTPLFCYDYIDLDKTDFHFKQENIEIKDYIKYFEMVKFISKNTVNTLIDKTNYKYHFHLYPAPNGRLLKLIQNISNIKFNNYDLPPIGQFALYTTSENNASRETGIKSPRVFFMIGEKSVFYILFIDLYHEIKS